MNKNLPRWSEVIDCLRGNHDQYVEVVLKISENKAFILAFSRNDNHNNCLIEVNRSVYPLIKYSNDQGVNGVYSFCWVNHMSWQNPICDAGAWVGPLVNSFGPTYEKIVSDLCQKFEKLKLLEKDKLSDYKEGFLDSIVVKQSQSLAVTRGVIEIYNPCDGKPIGYYQMLVSPPPELGRIKRDSETFVDNSLLLFLISYFPQIFISGNQEEPIVFCQKKRNGLIKVRAMVFPPNCKEFYL